MGEGKISSHRVDIYLTYRRQGAARITSDSRCLKANMGGFVAPIVIVLGFVCTLRGQVSSFSVASERWLFL
jgi:hypothetical protein